MRGEREGGREFILSPCITEQFPSSIHTLTSEVFWRSLGILWIGIATSPVLGCLAPKLSYALAILSSTAGHPRIHSTCLFACLLTLSVSSSSPASDPDSDP